MRQMKVPRTLPTVDDPVASRPDTPPRPTSRWLPGLSVGSAVAAYALIIFGSQVRVSDSGMGCPDWPLCKGNVGPIYEFHALMEQTHPYPGNRPDVTQFGEVLDELTSRYAALLDTHGDADTADSAPSGPTVVFDAGQNSAANFAHLTGAGLHYVGSLPPSSFPDLLALPAPPARRRRPVDPHQYPGLSAYDTRAMVFGVDRRVVLTHSANLHAKQAADFDQTLTKTTPELGELAATLARGKTRRLPDAVQAEVARITRPRWVARVLTTQLTGTTAATMRLTWQIDPAARKALETEIFGKRLLVTDHDHWAVPEVVAGYRSQNDVESGFRQLKDPHVVGFSPMFHWTESKIRVHVFYCVLALAVAHLMRRQAHQAGLDLSVRELLTNLAGIQETVLLYPTGNKGRPRAQRILTDTNPTQAALFELFELD